MRDLYDLIIRDIVNASEKYLPFSIITGSLVIILLYGITICFNKKLNKIDRFGIAKNRLSHLILWLVFCIYIYMVVGIVFLSREPGSRDAVHLQLFGIFSKNIWARTFAFENIVMFIPFGFMLPLIWNKYISFKGCIFAGFLSSLTIEAVQHVTKRGYSELDDILNNMLGTIIGYGILVVVKVIGSKLRSRFQFK